MKYLITVLSVLTLALPVFASEVCTARVGAPMSVFHSTLNAIRSGDPKYDKGVQIAENSGLVERGAGERVHVIQEKIYLVRLDTSGMELIIRDGQTGYPEPLWMFRADLLDCVEE